MCFFIYRNYHFLCFFTDYPFLLLPLSPTSLLFLLLSIFFPSADSSLYSISLGSYPGDSQEDVIDLYNEQDGLDIEGNDINDVGVGTEWGQIDERQREKNDIALEEEKSGMLMSSTVQNIRTMSVPNTRAICGSTDSSGGGSNHNNLNSNNINNSHSRNNSHSSINSAHSNANNKNKNSIGSPEIIINNPLNNINNNIVYFNIKTDNLSNGFHDNNGNNSNKKNNNINTNTTIDINTKNISDTNDTSDFFTGESNSHNSKLNSPTAQI